jgi:hypothetical protein
MSRGFETYEEAFAHASKLADESGMSRGLEKLSAEFRVFLLPEPHNRFGFELRCQVVTSTNNKVAPGYEADFGLPVRQ